jgi:lysophospholipid acyltransferase (LPLAT)-like uncharacterized protein
VKIRNPWLIKFCAWCLGKTFRLIAKTIRYRVISAVPGTNPADPDTPDYYLYAMWHDEVLIPITCRATIKRFAAGNRMSALVSRHQDGSILTEFMNQFEVEAIRGSSSRGGAAAIHKLLKTANSTHVVITPDGPRGPRHEVKQGIVYVASQTGLAVCPVANAITRSWDLKGSWTNQIVPQPFSNAYLLIGKPIPIPADLTRAQISEYQALIEREMHKLQELSPRFTSGELTELPPVEESDSHSFAA